jgi:hypothetical protein
MELNLETVIFKKWQKILSQISKMSGTMVQPPESIDFPLTVDIRGRVANGLICK